MKYSEDRIQEALDQDALRDAEKITGKSYKEDKDTQGLGLDLHLKKNDALRVMLTKNRDTIFSSSQEYYTEIIQENGFEKFYHEDFEGRNDTEDSLQLWYRPGLFLCFDTYGKNINGSHLYYNWKPTVDDYPWQIFSSYSWENDIVVGNHDGREALIHNITQLEKHGEFIEPWEHCAFHWISHYMDHDVFKDEDNFQKCTTYYKDKTDKILPDEYKKLFAWEPEGD